MINTLIAIISIILPVIIIIGLGYIWNKIGNNLNQKEIIKFIAWIGAPCLVFSSLVNLDSSFSVIINIIIAAILMILGMIFFAYIILKIFKLHFRTYVNPITFVNSGNLGVTLCLLAFGRVGLEISIIYFAVVSIANFTLGVSIWSGNWSPRILMKNPILYSVIAVIIIHLIKIPVPKIASNTIDLLAGATIPLLLFSMGISIANIKFNIEYKLILLIIFRTLFALALAYSITIALELDELLQKIILLQAVLPAALFNFLFASEYSISPPEVASYIILSTFISIITISLFLLIIL